MVARIRLAGTSFFDDAAEIFDTPHHPWLGVAMYLVSAFALGSLLSETWHATLLA